MFKRSVFLGAIFLTVYGCAAATPLMKAVDKADIAAIRSIADKNNVNERDKKGGTPVYYAAWYGNAGVVRALIDAGADVNISDNSGRKALMNAAAEGKPEIAKLLLNHGADANARDKNGDTALHYAASLYKDTVVDVLAENGADVNAVNNAGATAMHSLGYAYGPDAERTARSLIGHGANVTIRDKTGVSPLRYALNYKNIPIVAAMRNGYLGSPEPKEKSAWNDIENALQNTARHKPNPDLFLVVEGQEQRFQTALADCNELVMHDKAKMLLMMGPVFYGLSAVMDSAKLPENFKDCMYRMGFPSPSR